MHYRPLGKTGLSLSHLGYGASPLGGTFGEVNEADAIQCVHTALELGVNYIDVSPFYGQTTAEVRLGRALRGIARDRYYLSTKVGRYGGNDFDFSAPRVRRSVDESLSRLGVEYVDILLCHDIEFAPLNQIIEETLPALRYIVSSGKARFIGVSGLPLYIFPTIIERTNIDVVLSYCHNTLSDTSLDTLLPYLHEKGIGVINASPLGMGLLQGNPEAIPEWHPAPQTLRDAVGHAAAHCRSKNADLADLAIAFSVNRPDISSTLVGSASEREMRHNIAVAQKAPDPMLLAEVRALLRPVRDLTWPSGMPENDPQHHGVYPR
jgi:L-galactose dehydrogenase